MPTLAAAQRWIAPRGRRPLWVAAVVLPCLIAGLSGVLVVAGTGTLEILPRIAGGVVGAIVGLLVGVGAGDELCAALKPIKLQVEKRWAPTRPYGPGAVAVLVVFAFLLCAFSAYGRLDAVLHALHKPGEASFGAGSLTAFIRFPTEIATELSEVAKTWWRDADSRRLAESGVAFREVRQLFGLQSAVDTLVLAPAYAWLLIWLIGGTRRFIQKEWPNMRLTTNSRLIAAYLRASKWAVFGVLVGVTADWLENGLAASLVSSVWSGFRPGVDPGLESVCVEACVIAALMLGLSTWLKLGGLLFASGYLVFAAVLALQHGGDGPKTWVRFPRLRAIAFRLLLPVLVVAALAAFLHTNDQAPDVLRRWTAAGSRPVIAWGLAATVVLGAVVGLSTWWLLLEPETPQPPPQPSAPRAQSFRQWIDSIGQSFVARLTPLGWWFLGAGTLWYAIIWHTAWRAAAADAPFNVVFLVVCVASGAALAWTGSYLSRRHPTRMRRVATWLGVLGVAALLATAMLVSRGWFSLMPIGIVLLLLVLGIPVRHWPTHQREQFAQLHVLAAFMAAIVSLAVGVALLSAGLDVWLYHFWRRDEVGQRQADILLLLAVLSAFLVAPVMYLVVRVGIRRYLGGLHTVGRRRFGALVSAVGLLTGVFLWIGAVALLAGRPDHIYGIASGAGLLAVLAASLTALTLVGTGLEALTEEAFPTPPPLYRIFAGDATSILPIVAMWVMATIAFGIADPVHDTRVAKDESSSSAPRTHRADALTIAEAFDQWQYRHCLGAPDTAPATEARVRARPIVPVILVATAGGGIRAAAWTSYVLDSTFQYAQWQQCVGAPTFAERRSSWVFAMSGVSGGSVGLATYAARQAAADLTPAGSQLNGNQWREMRDAETLSADPRRDGWIRANLGADGLTPNIAWLLLVEGPHSVFRFPLERDRAEVLEGTFEQWPANATIGAVAPGSIGFFELHERTALPWLLLNGTSVETGCRFNGSILRTAGITPSNEPRPPLSCVTPIDLQDARAEAFGATVDLVDFVCKEWDIPLSAVAHMSARFPYVSPSGGLEHCKAQADRAPLRTFVVDGGYHEGSGMASAHDVWLTLAPHIADYNARESSPVSIVPMLVQIDNGYDEPVGPGATPIQPQLLVPPATALSARSAVEARARHAGQIAFTQPFSLAAGLWYCGPRYAHFALRAHPGPSAPLGWVLSDVSFDDFVRQLRTMTPAEPPSATPLTAPSLPGEIVASWFPPVAPAEHVSNDPQCRPQTTQAAS